MKLPKGVTIVGLGDPATLHNTIADAVGEPRAPNYVSQEVFEAHVERATKLITAAQRDLKRELSTGERCDLLADNTPWTTAHICNVVVALSVKQKFGESK
jgi:hypothetical protein